jgi:hypothetical protein
MITYSLVSLFKFSLALQPPPPNRPLDGLASSFGFSTSFVASKSSSFLSAAVRCSVKSRLLTHNTRQALIRCMLYVRSSTQCKGGSAEIGTLYAVVRQANVKVRCERLLQKQLML